MKRKCLPSIHKKMSALYIWKENVCPLSIHEKKMFALHEKQMFALYPWKANVCPLSMKSKCLPSIHEKQMFALSLYMKRKCLPSIHEKKMFALYPWKENVCPLSMKSKCLPSMHDVIMDRGQIKYLYLINHILRSICCFIHTCSTTCIDICLQEYLYTAQYPTIWYGKCFIIKPPLVWMCVWVGGSIRIYRSWGAWCKYLIQNVHRLRSILQKMAKKRQKI